MTTHTGIVAEVTDGDTIVVRGINRPIRLDGYDAPERRQRGYEAAKQYLTNLVLGKKVTVETVTTDTHGRFVGKVTVGNTSVNDAMNRKLGKR